ncbi:MAG: serine--tRNA ligase [Chloroflexi bacterium]|nr:serine--tRNA ligase [Chloroflexota bacterium]
MLSIQKLVENPDHFRERLESRGEQPPIDKIVELDVKRRSLIVDVDALRGRRNETSKAIGAAKQKPSPEQIAEMREVGDHIKEIEADLRETEEALRDLVIVLPNLPLSDVPIGLDESSNVIIKTIGEVDETAPGVEPHWDSGPRLGMLNLEAGARMSGARFFVLSGAGAQLQRALTSWMLDVHVRENGYTEIAPPLLVRGETMLGSGNLPKFASNLYRDDESDLWLIPTAEVSLNALHAGEIIEAGVLPLKYVAHTPSFRKEDTAAGRDTRGIKRVHQFEKVEMFRYAEPEDSPAALDEMVTQATDLCARLGFAYRVISLCAGDIGFQSAKTFDIEVWSPGVQEWLEVSSISTCGDFQARRSGTRYRPTPGASSRYPFTLNGSGLAVPRIMIAIMENGLNPDGSITVPDVLVPYTGFDRIEVPSK